MATQTTIVKAPTYDGDTEADTTHLAKKINDVTSAATTIHSVSISKSGRYVIACIVWA